MSFKLSIETDNDAFNGFPLQETARLLREIVAVDLERGKTDGIIRDYNGNNVGRWTFDGSAWAMKKRSAK